MSHVDPMNLVVEQSNYKNASSRPKYQASIFLLSQRVKECEKYREAVENKRRATLERSRQLNEEVIKKTISTVEEKESLSQLSLSRKKEKSKQQLEVLRQAEEEHREKAQALQGMKNFRVHAAQKEAATRRDAAFHRKLEIVSNRVSRAQQCSFLRNDSFVSQYEKLSRLSFEKEKSKCSLAAARRDSLKKQITEQLSRKSQLQSQEIVRAASARSRHEAVLASRLRIEEHKLQLHDERRLRALSAHRETLQERQRKKQERDEKTCNSKKRAEDLKVRQQAIFMNHFDEAREVGQVMADFNKKYRKAYTLSPTRI